MLLFASFVAMVYMTDRLTYALVRFGCFRGGVREDLGRDHTHTPAIFLQCCQNGRCETDTGSGPLVGLVASSPPLVNYRWVSCLCSVDVCASVVGLCYLPLFYCDFRCLWLGFFSTAFLCFVIRKKKNYFVGTPTWFTLVEQDLVQTEQCRELQQLLGINLPLTLMCL